MTAAPTVPVDTRGQCADIISKFFEILSQDLIEVHLGDMERTLKCFSPSPERPHCLQAVKPHDTIDPHINFPDQPVLDSLLQASVRKAGERAFVFVLRLLRNLLANKPDCEKSVAPLLKGAEHKEKVLSDLKKGVLSSPEFERFIQQRLPSRCSSLEDYVINRHQVLLYDLTIHDLCRLIIACPENASSSIAARATTTAFFRQVFAIGYACNIGLEARPFFIDHGFGPTGEQLDWPSYVFIPAGAIWGKGAGVDVSCGVAFGGGVDLSERKGRDGAYIGGSWSSTLYHGHSHVGGNRASAGAESRERILHFGLTVEDGRRLPWGRYIEAEEQLRGDMYEGVRTYLLTPKGRGQERLSSV